MKHFFTVLLLAFWGMAAAQQSAGAPAFVSNYQLYKSLQAEEFVTDQVKIIVEAGVIVIDTGDNRFHYHVRLWRTDTMSNGWRKEYYETQGRDQYILIDYDQAGHIIQAQYINRENGARVYYLNRERNG